MRGGGEGEGKEKEGEREIGGKDYLAVGGAFDIYKSWKFSGIGKGGREFARLVLALAVFSGPPIIEIYLSRPTILTRNL